MNILSHFPHLGLSKQPQKSGTVVFTTPHRIKFESSRTKQTFSLTDRKLPTKQAYNISMISIVTALKRSLRRLCFHRCLSVHRRSVYPTACWDTPTPRDQRQTPLGTRGRHLLGRNPPQADTPHAVHAGIWSTSGRYASHWNAFLFSKN